MRTTLKIDDDIVQAAKTLARIEQRSLGEVVSDLARKGLKPMPGNSERSGFPLFDVPENTPLMTDESVRDALDDDR